MLGWTPRRRHHPSPEFGPAKLEPARTDRLSPPPPTLASPLRAALSPGTGWRRAAHGPRGPATRGTRRVASEDCGAHPCASAPGPRTPAPLGSCAREPGSGPPRCSPPGAASDRGGEPGTGPGSNRGPRRCRWSSATELPPGPFRFVFVVSSACLSRAAEFPSDLHHALAPPPVPLLSAGSVPHAPSRERAAPGPAARPPVASAAHTRHLGVWTGRCAPRILARAPRRARAATWWPGRALRHAVQRWRHLCPCQPPARPQTLSLTLLRTL